MTVGEVERDGGGRGTSGEPGPGRMFVRGVENGHFLRTLDEGVSEGEPETGKGRETLSQVQNDRD